MDGSGMSFRRDYQPVVDRVREGVAEVEGERARMQVVADALWDAFGGDGPGRGVSWIGFYTMAPSGEEMLLGPRRDKPACSPIGMQGVCGLSYTERMAIVVRDVRELGDGYIACDPKDLSEVVVPLFDAWGGCAGVLDGDSYEVGAFDERDVAGLTQVLEAAGLTIAPAGSVRVRVL